ncbi:hypothetical protein MNBD_GAMMA25-1876 [hydrothermal vent metagenome]|uniref:Peptidase C39-like domain-containing protein n=1 Tax=hydrothermal vent metagenome TaxID=652676 RepID=A0A3B1B7X9_9ZZZZ
MFTTFRGIIYLNSLLFLLLGCANSPQTHQLLATPPSSLPIEIELTSTPFISQTENYCGPAALATVLQAQGRAVTISELGELLYLPQREGSLQIEMDATARSFEMLSYPLSGNISDLLTEVSAGNPVLVFQNLGLSWYPRWHYAVVIGFDLEQGEIILRSGTIKRYVINLSTFEQTWRRTDYWARVVVAADKIPVTATALKFIKAVNALETSGHIETAAQAYRKAATRWPQNITVLQAWGNSEFEQGAFAEAESAFRQAITVNPTTASVWNNLAYVLMARQCTQGAREAIRCARKLSPDDENIIASENDISQIKPSRGKSCAVLQCSE